MFERAKSACRKEKKDTPDFIEDMLSLIKINHPN